MKGDITCLFNAIRRWCRRMHNEHRDFQSGWLYHKHVDEIVVTKNELLIQLGIADDWDDSLIALLAYGKKLPNYETSLLLVSLKMEFLGSFVYSVDRKRATKPPVKTYVHKLFEGSYETPDEVRDHLRIIGINPTDENVQCVFRKLLFVVGTCCPCMADSVELWRNDTYRCFVEYAIEQNDFSFFSPCAAQNIVNAIPRDLPVFGSKRSHIMKLVPDDLDQQIYHSTWKINLRH